MHCRNDDWLYGTHFRFLLLCASLFFYIYPVTLVSSGLSLWILSYMLFFILWIMAPFNILSVAFFKSNISLLLFLSIYAGLVTTITGVNDYTFAIQIFKVATIYVMTGIFVGLICVKNYNHLCLIVFLKAFVVCVVVQSLFIAASIVSIEFRYILDTIIVATGNTNYLESFRVRGFSSSGGSALSLIQAIGVATALYIYRLNGRFIYFIAALVAWIPTIAVGRTGFFLGALLLIINIFKSNSNAMKKKRFDIIFLIGFVVSIIFFLGSFIDQEALDRTFDYALPWAFEFFINAERGDFSTATTTELSRMLIIPDQIRHLIFGIGAFDSAAFGYSRSDSGYIKTLLASGIIGFLIFYLIVIKQFVGLINQAVKLELKLFFVTILVIALFFEIKEPYLYQNYFGKFIFLLFGVSTAWAFVRNDRKDSRE